MYKRQGQVLTIHTSEPRPALLNYLGDPYACIIDVDAGFDNGIVAGTGPYIAVDCESGDHLTLVKNENYWNGTPKIDELTIRTISEGSTLANALLSGEIQAAYGKFDGIVINPAAYTHTSVAILDALKAVSIPTVEVHISDVNTREEFRHFSYVSLAAKKTIVGHGTDGYPEAVDWLCAQK